MTAVGAVGVRPIAFVLPDLTGGGAERVTFSVAAGLRQRGWPVDLVHLRSRGELLDAVPAGIERVDLGARHAALAIGPLARYLRRRRPGAIIAGQAVANCIAVWARRRTDCNAPLILVEHNTPSVAYGPDSRWHHRLLPPAMRRAYPYADAIVAVSHGVARDLAVTAGLSLSAIRVVYNPVITSEVECQSGRRPRHPWFQSGQPPVVLGVGRLRPQKDFATLIRAFAKLPVPARLVILGEGPERRRLTALARQLGVAATVDLPGFVREPWGYIGHAAVFALSSRWEGLPTVLIEALAAGTPVVSTRCPSGPAEILAEGRYGALVDVADSADLSAALHSALTTDASPASDLAGHLAAFRPATAVTAYSELLHQLGTTAASARPP